MPACPAIDSLAFLPGVISTSGTGCTQLSPLPGFNPSFLNWSVNSETVFSSPAVPGLRP